MSAITLLTCLALLPDAGPAVPMVDPPTLDVTRNRVEQVEAKIKEINRLTETLRKIRQEIGPQGTQNINEYVAHSLLILKTRAVILVKMQQVCKEALEAKYALEATLEDYNLWLDAAQAASKQRDLAREQNVKKLRAEAALAEQEFHIIARNLQRMLQERRKGTKDEAELAQIDDHLARLAAYFEALKKSGFVPRTNADLEKKYGDMEADQYKALEKRLEVVEDIYSDKTYEAEFIEKNVLGSTSDLLNKLNDGRKEQLERARKLLDESRKLETIAVEVSIASKHIREMLSELEQPMDIANRGLLIETRLAVERDVGKSLREITGVERRSIWDRLAPVPPMMEK
jgi:hypothetical protein